MKKKIFAISGSVRKSSSNENLLKFIAEKYSDELEVEIYEGIENLPHFSPDLDNENLPEAVANFREKINAADGVIVCTPEYVFSLPGSLKNALEWNVSTTVFSDKPTAIIVAAAHGVKALEALDLIMTTIQCKIADDAKLLIQGVKGKFNSEGEIIDTEVINKLDVLVRAFITSI